jgi:hypothetical protein
MLRVGVGVAARTAAKLVGTGDGNTMGDFDIVGEVAWMAPLAVQPVVGLYGGAGIRSFRSGGEVAAGGAMPVLGGELGVRVPLGGLPLVVEPSFRAQMDLSRVELASDAGTQVLAPLELRAGLMIGYAPR